MEYLQINGGLPILGETPKTSAFSTNAQSRFASFVLDGVKRPLRFASHTRLCPYIAAIPEATYVSRVSALEGRRVSSKCHRELVAGTEERVESMVFHLSAPSI